MRASLLRIVALIRKEFLAVLKDPRSRFIIFLPPILQCLLFGYAASFDLNSAFYAVLDQDRSPASIALLARLDGSTIFQRQADLRRIEDITTWIDSGRALLVIQIPRISNAICWPANPHRSRSSPMAATPTPPEPRWAMSRPWSTISTPTGAPIMVSPAHRFGSSPAHGTIPIWIHAGA